MSEKNKKPELTTLDEPKKLEEGYGTKGENFLERFNEALVEQVERQAIHNDVQVAEQTVIELPAPQYVISNPATAKAIQSEPVHNDGGIVLPIPANVIPNGRGRNILKARQDKPVKNV